MGVPLHTFQHRTDGKLYRLQVTLQLYLPLLQMHFICTCVVLSRPLKPPLRGQKPTESTAWMISPLGPTLWWQSWLTLGESTSVDWLRSLGSGCCSTWVDSIHELTCWLVDFSDTTWKMPWLSTNLQWKEDSAMARSTKYTPLVPSESTHDSPNSPPLFSPPPDRNLWLGRERLKGPQRNQKFPKVNFHFLQVQGKSQGSGPNGGGLRGGWPAWSWPGGVLT